MRKIIDKIKNIQKQLDDVKKEVEGKQEQIDFSEFVGRWGNILCIKGEKLLRSFHNKEIVYSNVGKEHYTDPLSYEEIPASELKKGDVFYCGSLEDAKLEEGKMELIDFGIFKNDCYYYYLDNCDGKEFIANNTTYLDKFVRFKRE